jgi:TolB protein
VVKGFESAWSPRGDRLAFTRQDTSPTLLFDTSEIWTLSPSHPAKMARLSPKTLHADYPDWSPDGKTIAFSAFRGDESQNGGIYVMPASGGTPRLLTRSPGNEAEPSWSPDGKEIAYWRWSGREEGDSDIWVMNADGTQQRAITRTPDSDYAPAWSPDGEHIAFQREYPADPLSINYEIVVVNADGSGFRRLTRNRSFDDSEPVWSPDGKQIVFISDRTGVEELFVMDADGSGLKELTKHDADSGGYFDPAWGASP